MVACLVCLLFRKLTRELLAFGLGGRVHTQHLQSSSEKETNLVSWSGMGVRAFSLNGLIERHYRLERPQGLQGGRMQ